VRTACHVQELPCWVAVYVCMYACMYVCVYVWVCIMYHGRTHERPRGCRRRPHLREVRVHTCIKTHTACLPCLGIAMKQRLPTTRPRLPPSVSCFLLPHLPPDLSPPFHTHTHTQGGDRAVVRRPPDVTADGQASPDQDGVPQLCHGQPHLGAAPAEPGRQVRVCVCVCVCVCVVFQLWVRLRPCWAHGRVWWWW
jgi:hypothetical protein